MDRGVLVENTGFAWQVTNDITEFTCADFLKPGEKTPVACRMSTVTHEKGCGPAL